MARLVVEGSELVVRLSPRERLGAFVAHDPRAPLAAVRSVRAVPDGWTALRGLRAPGTGFPGVIMLGTLRSKGLRDFAAVYRHRPAVVVELEGGRWSRFVITADDAESVASTLPVPG